MYICKTSKMWESRGDVSFVSSILRCRGYDLRVSLPDKFNTSRFFLHTWKVLQNTLLKWLQVLDLPPSVYLLQNTKKLCLNTPICLPWSTENWPCVTAKLTMKNACFSWISILSFQTRITIFQSNHIVTDDHLDFFTNLMTGREFWSTSVVYKSKTELVGQKTLETCLQNNYVFLKF